MKLNNGIEMPQVGIGTFMLSRNEAYDSVKAALSIGYRLIDTANAYCAYGSWPFKVRAHFARIGNQWYYTN